MHFYFVGCFVAKFYEGLVSIFCYSSLYLPGASTGGLRCLLWIVFSSVLPMQESMQ